MVVEDEIVKKKKKKRHEHTPGGEGGGRAEVSVKKASLIVLFIRTFHV